MIYIGNAFSLNMLEYIPACVYVEDVDAEHVRQETGLISVIGHESTRQILAQEFEIFLPPVERPTIHLNSGDVLYVAQYKGPRLPEGATTLPPGARIFFYKVTIK